MEFKSFDRKLFADNDTRARAAVKLYLGDSCIDNKDIYGPDLIYRNRYIEVEICRAWKTDKFPYTETSIPGRKGKWRDLDIEFWRLSDDLSRAHVIKGSQLTNEYLVEVPNKCVKEGEFFYRIPIDLVDEIILKER